MSVVIECPCGVVLREDEVDEVVGVAREHALRTHDMELSEQQARDMVHVE